MNYSEQHLRAWLLDRPLIKIEALEHQADCPKATIRHFLKDRRSISANHLESIVKILSIYGFIPLGDE